MGGGIVKGAATHAAAPSGFAKFASAEVLFDEVRRFTAEKRKHHETLLEAERSILSSYEAFSPQERVRFFSLLYDRFAENYDRHMEETGHFKAINGLLWMAMPHLRFPLLDITAGTGVPLLFALEYARWSGRIKNSRLDNGIRSKLVEGSGVAYANEVSPKMLMKAQERLMGFEVEFMNQDAFDLQVEGMATVQCSQTFHLISDEDKARLVGAIHRSLRKGGVAVVMEEDPFRISPTPSIEEVSLFLRAVVRPIKHHGTLIAYFENNGFERLEERAVYPIDSEHVMRLHMFQKNVTSL